MNEPLDDPTVTSVSSVNTFHTADGLDAEVRITRDVYGRRQRPPSPGDVPKDILDALRAWLDGAR